MLKKRVGHQKTSLRFFENLAVAILTAATEAAEGGAGMGMREARARAAPLKRLAVAVGAGAGGTLCR